MQPITTLLPTLSPPTAPPSSSPRAQLCAVDGSAPPRRNPPRLGAALAEAVATCRRRRPAAADLRAATALLGDLVALYARDQVAYAALIAATPGVDVWLWQIALALAAGGWPRLGREVLGVLPGVAPCAEAVRVLEAAAAAQDAAVAAAAAGDSVLAAGDAVAPRHAAAGGW